MGNISSPSKFVWQVRNAPYGTSAGQNIIGGSVYYLPLNGQATATTTANQHRTRNLAPAQLTRVRLEIDANTLANDAPIKVQTNGGAVTVASGTIPAGSTTTLELTLENPVLGQGSWYDIQLDLSADIATQILRPKGITLEGVH